MGGALNHHDQQTAGEGGPPPPHHLDAFLSNHSGLEEAQHPLLQRKKGDNNNSATTTTAKKPDFNATAGNHKLGPQYISHHPEKHPGNLFLRCLASAYLWAIIPLAFLTGLCLQLVAWTLLFPLFLAKPSFRLKLLGQILRGTQNFFMLVINPFWRVKVVRLPTDPNYAPNGKTLVMCNHLTAADPWICNKAFFPWEMKWICKSDLFKIPIAGQSIAMGGDLMVKFTGVKGGWGTQPGSVKELMRQVNELGRIHNLGVVVFPEGTRSRTGRLQPFREGFFRFAIEHDREILPCVAHNSQNLWPVGQYLIGCGTAYVSIGDPIKPQLNESVASLKERVRATMIGLLREMPLWEEEIDGPLDPDTVITTRGTGLIATK